MGFMFVLVGWLFDGPGNRSSRGVLKTLGLGVWKGWGGDTRPWGFFGRVHVGLKGEGHVELRSTRGGLGMDPTGTLLARVCWCFLVLN